MKLNRGSLPRTTGSFSWDEKLVATDGTYLVGDHRFNEVVFLGPPLGNRIPQLWSAFRNQMREILSFQEVSRLQADLVRIAQELTGSQKQLIEAATLSEIMSLSEFLISRGIAISRDSGISLTSGESFPPQSWISDNHGIAVPLPPVGQCMTARELEEKDLELMALQGGKSFFIESLRSVDAPHHATHFDVQRPSVRRVDQGPNGPGLWMRMGKLLVPGAAASGNTVFYAHDFVFFELLQLLRPACGD